MLYELILVTAVGVQGVGQYDDYIDCAVEAEHWQEQGVPAGCVQKMTPEDAFEKFIGILNHMDQLQQDAYPPKSELKPIPCPEGAECIELK